VQLLPRRWAAEAVLFRNVAVGSRSVQMLYGRVSGSDGANSVSAVSDRARGLVMSTCGIVVLALNVIEAADRGATAWNILTIAVGAFLLFYGFAVLARKPR